MHRLRGRYLEGIHSFALLLTPYDLCYKHDFMLALSNQLTRLIKYLDKLIQNYYYNEILRFTYSTNKYSVPSSSELFEDLHPSLVWHRSMKTEHLQVYEYQTIRIT